MKTLVLPQALFSDFWLSLQIGYSKVIRWKSYLDANPVLRKQTNLEHVVSVSFLFEYFLNFEFYNQKHIEKTLLKTAIVVHELGEIENDDTLYHNKTNDGHIAELRSLMSILDSMPELGSNREFFMKAFLLPFATQTLTSFEMLDDPKIQETFEGIKRDYALEAEIFNALERFDYFLYAFESYQNHGDVVILKHVLANQKHHLDGYVHLPEFNKLWTPEIQAFASEFLEEYSSIPGPKEEGGIPQAYAYAKEKDWM